MADNNLNKKKKRSTTDQQIKLSKSTIPTTLTSTSTTPTDNEHTLKIIQVRRLMKERDNYRNNNNFIKADEIKNKLIEMGVFIKDQKNGPSGWKFLDGSSNKLPPGTKVPDDAIRIKRKRDDEPEVEETSTSKSELKSKKSKKSDSNSTTTNTTTTSTISSETSRNLNVLRENLVASAKNQTPGQKVIDGVVLVDKSVGDGPEARPGDRVKVHYVGKLKTTGKVFDASTKKPFTFRLGAGEVIRGWDIGVKGMRVGGQRTLTIPPEKAYGRHGAPPQIPGNAWLVFDVKLLEVR